MNTCLLVILMVKELLECFTKKNCKKTNQKQFGIEKVIKRKDNKLYVKQKGYINSPISWIEKKDIVQISEHFPKPKPLGENVKIALDFFNYATKAELKSARGVDTSEFSKKADLVILKFYVDK